MRAMESIVRAFGLVDSKPVNRLFRRPEPEPDQAPAEIEWGESSEFIFPPQINYSWSWPDDDPDEEEEDQEEEPEGERVWSEVARETSNVRVENPNDAAQFVIVERIDTLIMLDSLTGETVTMRFRNT